MTATASEFAPSPAADRPLMPLAIAILGNGAKEAVPAAADRIASAISQSPGLILSLVDLSSDSDLTNLEADVALILGGDGTVLHTARRMGDAPAPVLGVHFGRLGFLTEVTVPELLDCLPDLTHRRYTIDNRMALIGTLMPRNAPPRTFRCLNDVVLRTAPVFHMGEVELRIDGEHVMTYRGDGLILATPMGSTAHSLSAGGPILPPDSHMIVITPICAHALTQRPLVDACQKAYELIPKVEEAALTLVIDGQVQLPLNPGDRILVRRSPVPFPMVRLVGFSFYRTLREKLGWGTRPPGETNPGTGTFP